MKLVACTLCCALVLAAARREEGSADFPLNTDDIDGFDFGSGDDLEEVELIPDKLDDEIDESFYDIHFTKSETWKPEDKSDNLDYYDDNYEYTDNLIDDSVLKFDKEDSFPDIEIKPKPGKEDEFILETSQILVMVGSAFISFGVVMIAFFMCRRAVDKKKQKTIPYIVPAPLQCKEPSPILKDYQRVPTDTREFLQSSEEARIEMCGGREGADPLLEQ